MKYTILTQGEAHKILCPWLKDLGIYPKFEKAFQDEVTRRKNNEELWALETEERTYYTISLDQSENPYLLVGINFKDFNLSSVARIAQAEERMGVCCFKFLFTRYLWNELRNKHHDPRPRILSAIASTPGGKTFFERLDNDRPEGIERIDITLKSPDAYGDNHEVKIHYKP